MTKAKNIFLTGSSRGIGAVSAIELASAGHKVGCLSRKGIGPESVSVPAELADRIFNLKGDVDDMQSIVAALAKFREAVGEPINGIINNAGVHEEGSSSEMPPETFAKVLATNTTGVFIVCQAAYPHLVEAGGGLIVNLGSFFDKLGVRGNAAYCASKAGVGAVTRCLAVEWARKQIRVLNLAPGYIETDLNRDFLNSDKIRKYLAARIPTGGPVAAVEVGRTLAMLFSSEIGFLTGETIYLDGAQGVAA